MGRTKTKEDHVHCISCVNQRCMVRSQPGIACDLITCPLVCGAVFHSCKVDEHQLMCPLVRVPCLNSGYGCPTTLVRNQMSAHLEVCPAGVVCCTMEWNRWPVSCLDYTSYESLSRGVEEVEQLDMALALQDQRTLLESLKVIAMAPTTERAPPVPVSKENRAKEAALLTSEKIVSGINGLNEEHFSKLYDATVETARSLAAALDFVSSASSVDSSTECVNRGAPKPKFHNYQFFRGQGHNALPNGRIGFIPDRSLYRLKPKMEDKAVDTSDLEQDDDPMGLGEIDLITAALLFCLEESRECRRISDTVYIDGYRVDFGTQTFTFPAAILVTNTRVGDMASASASLEVEAVPHNHYLPANPRYQHMFPFVCGQSFRRDQFSSHFTNVHGDIHAGLNGWMEHRCPLAYYGCTFSQHLRSFGIQPCPSSKLPGDSQSDQISGLPIEILWHIAGFLDSFSLCQLSLVSRTMREVCASLLQSRGIVELQWERRQSPGAHGTVSWQIKNRVWRFSTAFSPVLSWGFTDLPSMSNHLKKCHFNVVEHKTEPVPLPAMSVFCLNVSLYIKELT
uniref:F-box protein 30b n=1 Tax=Anabas testudineus TaxID=64144 RepID=A0A7N6BJD5_ANATE